MAHPAYDEANAKLMSLFNSANISTAEQIADGIRGATDGKYQLRQFAGEDAKTLVRGKSTSETRQRSFQSRNEKKKYYSTLAINFTNGNSSHTSL
jgi:hypothetical protein